MTRYNSGFGHQQVLTGVTFARGEGDFVWDTAGKRYLDFFTDESLPFGHSTEVLREAMDVDLPLNVGLYENAYRAPLIDRLGEVFPGFDNFQFTWSHLSCSWQPCSPGRP
jgi:4-aminobutyrate aminotransferase-like enzyme